MDKANSLLCVSYLEDLGDLCTLQLLRKEIEPLAKSKNTFELFHDNFYQHFNGQVLQACVVELLETLMIFRSTFKKAI